MEFTTWLRTWLRRHPLKELPEADRARFTAEIMAKVRAVGPVSAGSPAAVPAQRWAFWPRLAVGIATAAAGVAVVVGTVTYSTSQLADRTTQDAQRLADVGGPERVVVRGDERKILLVEAPLSDEEWLEHTLQLLDQLDEDVPLDTAGDGSDEEWLDELQLLDKLELSAPS
ncbi:MAG: hypothetical protein HYZ89_00075 [Candidatus Omnitrophica bacterium]|nr:hypothetical protein [Candidatus Omnitrophota bacterium]